MCDRMHVPTNDPEQSDEEAQSLRQMLQWCFHTVKNVNQREYLRKNCRDSAGPAPEGTQVTSPSALDGRC